jgi:hypothetical protein
MGAAGSTKMMVRTGVDSNKINFAFFKSILVLGIPNLLLVASVEATFPF